MNRFSVLSDDAPKRPSHLAAVVKPKAATSGYVPPHLRAKVAAEKAARGFDAEDMTDATLFPTLGSAPVAKPKTAMNFSNTVSEAIRRDEAAAAAAAAAALEALNMTPEQMTDEQLEANGWARLRIPRGVDERRAWLAACAERWSALAQEIPPEDEWEGVSAWTTPYNPLEVLSKPVELKPTKLKAAALEIYDYQSDDGFEAHSP
jgi:hypothetical protein